MIAVDFTRTAESVAKTGADLTKWAKQQDTKADLAALFMPRRPQMSTAEAQQLMTEWSDDLEAMEAFVLEKRKFVRLPEDELGHFYSGNCYVFLCRYWMVIIETYRKTFNFYRSALKKKKKFSHSMAKMTRETARNSTRMIFSA